MYYTLSHLADELLHIHIYKNKQSNGKYKMSV